MGIRDTSYYGWQNYDLFGSTAQIVRDVIYYDSLIFSSSIYAVGHVDETTDGVTSGYWIVRKGDRNNNFTTIDKFSSSLSSSLHNGIATSIAIDNSGALYVCGHGGSADLTVPSGTLIVRKSHITASSDWNSVDFHIPDNGTFAYGTSVFVGKDDLVYVTAYESSSVGPLTSYVLRRSTDKGTTWQTVDHITGSISNLPTAKSIGVSPSLDAYYCLTTSEAHYVRKGTTSGSYTNVFYDPLTDVIGGGGGLRCLLAGRDNNVYVGAVSGSINEALLLSSSDDTNWHRLHVIESGFLSRIEGISEGGRNNSLYVTVTDSEAADLAQTYVRTEVSRSRQTGSFSVIDRQKGAAALSVHVSSGSLEEEVLIAGTFFVSGLTTKKGVVRYGRLTANSASLGPKMLATSFGYVHSEISGTVTEKFKLNNVSEFPHYGGLFQMPSLVLGTVHKGTVGNTVDDIIQVAHIGSVVKILWPAQKNAEVSRGVGSYAAGQAPGKLLTSFNPGDFFHVEPFNHMSLYCYAAKPASGTLDNIEIKVERRPLRGLGYATDPVVEYSASGSVMVGQLKDLIFKREVNYGDTSFSEDGYCIDIPLKNVKDIRISAKQSIGQSDDLNKQFVIWGRFISGSET